MFPMTPHANFIYRWSHLYVWFRIMSYSFMCARVSHFVQKLLTANFIYNCHNVFHKKLHKTPPFLNRLVYWDWFINEKVPWRKYVFHDLVDMPKFHNTVAHVFGSKQVNFNEGLLLGILNCKFLQK